MDACPIGINVRSTVATYSGIMDQLRAEFGKVSDKYTARDFSYNTCSFKCPECDGSGQISLDAQFLADVEMVCPRCSGTRYRSEASAVQLEGYSMPEVLALTAADWLIDMGPGGGADGGHIVAAGTPHDVAAAETMTAKYLQPHLLANEHRGV